MRSPKATDLRLSLAHPVNGEDAVREVKALKPDPNPSQAFEAVASSRSGVAPIDHEFGPGDERGLVAG